MPRNMLRSSVGRRPPLSGTSQRALIALGAPHSGGCDSERLLPHRSRPRSAAVARRLRCPAPARGRRRAGDRFARDVVRGLRAAPRRSGRRKSVAASAPSNSHASAPSTLSSIARSVARGDHAHADVIFLAGRGRNRIDARRRARAPCSRSRAPPPHTARSSSPTRARACATRRAASRVLSVEQRYDGVRRCCTSTIATLRKSHTSRPALRENCRR